jgi:hypothetical protein
MILSIHSFEGFHDDAWGSGELGQVPPVDGGVSNAQKATRLDEHLHLKVETPVPSQDGRLILIRKQLEAGIR